MTNQKELIPMRPGDVLRYERELKGLSIESAARQSRIKESVLHAIESGETGDIPSVYLRGYIRNYARFLGVDPAEFNEQMEHVRGAEPEVRTVFSVKAKRGGAEKWIKASSYLVASALIATLAWQFTHQAVRFSQGESELTQGTAVPAQSAEESQQAGGANNRSTSGTHMSASIASMEPLNSSSGTSTASPGVTEPAASAEALLDQRLSVTTSADTWIEIFDANGQQLEMDLIRAGSSRNYDGQAPFSIMIGRASAVELQFDGAIVDLGPYTRGNVARMTLGTE